MPADVSVVSFDDDAIASWMRPQLTTVALPHYELGREAVEVLFAENPQQRSNGRSMISRVPMPLRERESVRQLAADTDDETSQGAQLSVMAHS